MISLNALPFILGELGMISGLQRAQQNEVYCTHVSEQLDFALLGNALSLPSRRLTSDAEAEEVAAWAFEHCSSGKGPVLIEAMVCYGAPSFYARGATGQVPTTAVNPAPVEPLSLTQLPEPPSPQMDEEARAFARKVLEKHRPAKLMGCCRMLADGSGKVPPPIWSNPGLAEFSLRRGNNGAATKNHL